MAIVLSRSANPDPERTKKVEQVLLRHGLDLSMVNADATGWLMIDNDYPELV